VRGARAAVGGGVSDMNTATQIIEQIQALQAENDRLQGHARKMSDGAYRSNRLEYENGRLLDKIAGLERQVQDLRTDLNHWRKAVRYEQALKNPPKRVRHLPIFNDVRRAKRRDDWPKYLGYQTNPERIFLKNWRKENKREPCLNHGRGVLEIILSEDNDHAIDLTQRDATVAATVIQWLGTNCGRCFIEECEREIKTSVERERKAAKVPA
jgi:hypothetical protein